MRIGMSTACFYPQPLEEILPIIARLGVHAVEIFSTPKASSSRAFMKRWVRRRAASGWISCLCILIPR